MHVTTIPNRRATILAVLPLVLGAAIAWWFLSQSAGTVDIDFEKAALDQYTEATYPKDGPFQIHCQDLRDAQSCLDGWSARGKQMPILWLGNSQLHAINQYKTGQVPASATLFASLQHEGYDLLTFSEPNANLQEHYVLFAYLLSRLPVRVLILPVCYDDLRETGVRDDLVGILKDPGAIEALAVRREGRRLLTENSNAGTGDLAALERTTQQTVEAFLTSQLEEHWSLWRARPNLRGKFMTTLYTTRNTILGIKPTTKRKAIRGRSEENLAALDEILTLAQEHNVKVLLYVPPLRSDVDIPYEESDYDKFKIDLRSIAAQHGALFANFENLVPGTEWGLKNTTSLEGNMELDFMHFTGAGHELLAGELLATLRPILQGGKK